MEGDSYWHQVSFVNGSTPYNVGAYTWTGTIVNPSTYPLTTIVNLAVDASQASVGVVNFKATGTQMTGPEALASSLWPKSGPLQGWYSYVATDSNGDVLTALYGPISLQYQSQNLFGGGDGFLPTVATTISWGIPLTIVSPGIGIQQVVGPTGPPGAETNFDVRAYGAKVDGVTDDTDAVIEAGGVAGTGTVLIPNTGSPCLVSTVALTGLSCVIWCDGGAYFEQSAGATGNVVDFTGYIKPPIWSASSNRQSRQSHRIRVQGNGVTGLGNCGVFLGFGTTQSPGPCDFDIDVWNTGGPCVNGSIAELCNFDMVLSKPTDPTQPYFTASGAFNGNKVRAFLINAGTTDSASCFVIEDNGTNAPTNNEIDVTLEGFTPGPGVSGIYVRGIGNKARAWGVDMLDPSYTGTSITAGSNALTVTSAAFGSTFVGMSVALAAAALPTTFTGTLNGTTTISGISAGDIANLVPGCTVWGTNIPEGATIASVGATTCVLSVAATGSGTETINLIPAILTVTDATHVLLSVNAVTTVAAGTCQIGSPASTVVYLDTSSVANFGENVIEGPIRLNPAPYYKGPKTGVQIAQNGNVVRIPRSYGHPSGASVIINATIDYITAMVEGTEGGVGGLYPVGPAILNNSTATHNVTVDWSSGLPTVRSALGISDLAAPQVFTASGAWTPSTTGLAIFAADIIGGGAAGQNGGATNSGVGGGGGEVLRSVYLGNVLGAQSVVVGVTASSGNGNASSVPGGVNGTITAGGGKQPAGGDGSQAGAGSAGGTAAAGATTGLRGGPGYSRYGPGGGSGGGPTSASGGVGGSSQGTAGGTGTALGGGGGGSNGGSAGQNGSAGQGGNGANAGANTGGGGGGGGAGTAGGTGGTGGSGIVIIYQVA
jgi:hypothetical protein